MDDLMGPLRSLLRLNLCVISTQPNSASRILPVGFLLELMFVMVLSVVFPRFVPALMGLIWPETARR